MNIKTAKKVLKDIEVERVIPNPSQPRRVFNEDELLELAQSIKEHGIIEPITVEECGNDFMLHDGERRWRSSRMAGLKTIPAIVSPPLNGTGPRDRLERALVANVQRSEMHPIEEGMAYQKMMDDFGYTKPEVAKRTGKHYSRVQQCVAMLELDEDIQQLMLMRKLPCADPVRKSFLSIADPVERVRLAQALAERGATANGIKLACMKFLSAKNKLEGKRKTRTTLAEDAVEKKLPEWDALYQLGKVPPWQVVVNAAMSTCDSCSLRSIASHATCHDCALVISLQRMMEAVHVSK